MQAHLWNCCVECVNSISREKITFLIYCAEFRIKQLDVTVSCLYFTGNVCEGVKQCLITNCCVCLNRGLCGDDLISCDGV